jgi:MarR family transcriptional regulator, lower aerobic nicotinate degradation pathway regulator
LPISALFLQEKILRIFLKARYAEVSIRNVVRGRKAVKMSETEVKRAGSYCLDDQVGYLLRLASQRHANIFQTRTIAGLTPTQFSALIRISEQGTCSQNRLGRLAAMDVATIKGVVDRLRQKGLIVAGPDPDDKRRTLISLSPKGAALVGDMQKVGHAITAETLKPLSAAEQRNLVRLLRKLA